MSRKEIKRSLMDICDQISVHMRLKGLEVVPDGWHTSEEIGEAMSLNRSTVTRNIQAAVKKGMVEVRKFKVMTGRGVYPVFHYRFKEGQNPCKPRKSQQPR
jgi:hypothetical protein